MVTLENKKIPPETLEAIQEYLDDPGVFLILLIFSEKDRLPSIGAIRDEEIAALTRQRIQAEKDAKLAVVVDEHRTQNFDGSMQVNTDAGTTILFSSQELKNILEQARITLGNKLGRGAAPSG